MSNSENTKFKDLPLEEQLDLVSYVLQGNTLSSRRSECENFLEVVNDKPTVLTFKWDHMFKKNPSRLENLIKQKEALEEEIAALQASHSGSLPDDKPLCTQSPSEKKKVSDNAFVETDECGERITLKNWKELLSSGDRVISVDKEGNKKQHIIEDLEVISYQGFGFMFVEDDWVYFAADNTCEEGKSYYVKK